MPDLSLKIFDILKDFGRQGSGVRRRATARPWFGTL